MIEGKQHAFLERVGRFDRVERDPLSPQRRGHGKGGHEKGNHNAVLAILGEHATGEREDFKEGTEDWIYYLQPETPKSMIKELAEKLEEAGYVVKFY